MTRQIIISGVLLLLGASGAFPQEAKELYLTKCAVCHGQDGAAGTSIGKKLKIRPVKEAAVKENEAAMTKIVTEGKEPDMDAFGKTLSKAQIAAVVDYYRGLAK